MSEKGSAKMFQLAGMFEEIVDWTRMLIVMYPDHAHQEVEAVMTGKNHLGDITAHDSINLWALHSQPELLQPSDPGK